jgi:hypothetical protein
MSAPHAAIVPAPAGGRLGRKLTLALVLLLLALGSLGIGLALAAQAEPLSLSLSVALEERNGSGVTGTALVEAVDGATWVTITLDGPDGGYLSFLHGGSCSAFAAGPAIPLALATRGVPSATAIDLPLSELMGGDFVIDVHAANGTIDSILDPATSVACGVLFTAAEPESGGDGDESVSPPVAGIGPLDSGDDWLIASAAALCAASLVLSLSSIRRQPAVRTAPVVDPALQFGRGVSR